MATVAYIASYKAGLDLYTAGMQGVIYHCQIRCLTSLAETAVSLGTHQRGVGGEVAASQPKSVLPHSPDVLNTHPPISSYSSSPILSRDQLRGTELRERMNLTVFSLQNGYFLHHRHLVKSYRLRGGPRGRADTLQCPAAQFLQYCQDVAAAAAARRQAATRSRGWCEKETEKAS